MTTWNYFLMRTNTGDTGEIPGSPPASACPDIMPWGTQDPPADPLKFFTDNYNTAYDNVLVVGQPNRIFVRSKNLNTAKQSGEMVLFWSKASMLLWPTGDDGWSNNIIPTTSGQDSIPVSADPNQIVVSTNPFLWAPQPIYGDHYCLLGGVRDQNHPIPPPDSANIDTMDKLASWILNNRNCGWHNTRLTDTGSPQWMETTTFAGRKGGGKGRISVTAKNCPIGWNVMFEFYVPDKDGKICKLPWTRVDNDAEFGRFVDINVPEGYTTQVAWGAQFNGIQPSKKWQIQVEVSYLKKETSDSATRFDPRRTGRLPARRGPIPVYDEVVIGGRAVVTS